MVPAPWPLPWGPWLQMTQSALDAWMGLWTAALPQRQAEFVLQVQRQALEAWTAPLALAAPPPEPQPGPAPRRPMPAVPLARPADMARPRTMAPAVAQPEMPEPERTEPDAEEAVRAELIAAARPERAPPRPRKAVTPAAELRQSRSRKTLPHPRSPRPKTRR